MIYLSVIICWNILGVVGGRASISLYSRARDAARVTNQNRDLSGVYVRARAITEQLQKKQTDDPVTSSSNFVSRWNSYYAQNGSLQSGAPHQSQFHASGVKWLRPSHYEAYDNTAVYPEYVVIARSE